MQAIDIDTRLFLGMLSGKQPRIPHRLRLLPDRGQRAFPVNVNKQNFVARLERAQADGYGVGVQLCQCAFIARNDRVRETTKLSEAYLAVLCLDIDDGRPEPPIVPGLPPTMIVRTKRGFHIYWAIYRTRDWDKWEAIQRGLAHAYGGDLSITRISAVMRLPGTLHLKGTIPFLVEVVHYDHDRWYDLSQFDIFAMHDERREQRELDLDGIDLSDVQAEFPLLRHALIKALAKVWRATRGSRSNTLRMQAWHLGHFAPYAPRGWLGNCKVQLLKACRGWVDKDQAALERTAVENLNKGYHDGWENPPDMRATFERHKLKLEQRAFLESIHDDNVPARAIPQLIGTREQRELFDTERAASYAIASRLKALGRVSTKCWQDGKSWQAYVRSSAAQDITKSA